jgi:hypothetical protein
VARGVTLNAMQNKRAIITTPFPTLDQVAEFYRITAKRRAELDQMMEEIFRENADKNAPRSRTSAKRAAKKK